MPLQMAVQQQPPQSPQGYNGAHLVSTPQRVKVHDYKMAQNFDNEILKTVVNQFLKQI